MMTLNNTTYKTIVGNVSCIHKHLDIRDAFKCGEKYAIGEFTIIDNNDNKVGYGGPIIFKF